MKAPLSSTSSFKERGRRAFSGVCWAAVIVVAVDLTCRALLPGGELIETEDLIRERVETQPAPDIQIVGDSVARSGFITSALGDGVLKTRNDAMPASGTPKTYLLLERQFQLGNVPRVLIIAHSPHTFERVRYEVLVGGFAHWKEIPGLVPYAEHWTKVLYGVLTKLSYILMHRDSFQDLLKKGDASFFKERGLGKFMPPDLERMRAFGSRLAQGEFAKSKIPDHMTEFFKSPFTVAEMNDIYFRKILTLAKEYGVKVFWVTMPTPPRVMEARSTVRYEQEMLKYLRQYEKPGEFEILHGPFSVYKPELFNDQLHLNEAGAVQFACELGHVKGPVVAAAMGARAEPVSTSGRDEFSALLSPYCSSDAQLAAFAR